jgi:citrate synthase
MSEGLEGVIAAQTILSEVDGQAGRLVIRGLSLDEIAGRLAFEDVAHLLFHGFFDDLPDDLRPALGAARAEVFAEVSALDGKLAGLSPIEIVRALTARLADGDDLATALRLLAAPAVFTPAAVRARHGLAPIAPDPGLGHAADILRMLGDQPSAQEAKALDTYLVTACDHGLNASTFAARVVASTRAGLTSAVLAGLGALKGPLHGGAPGPVIEMLDAIGEPANARPWIEAALARGERLMGFGHRIYRVRDPRADAVKAGARPPRRRRADPARPPGPGRSRRDRGPSHPAGAQARPPAGDQPRILHRAPAGGARIAAGSLHLHLRLRPHRRLDRPRPRTAGRRPADPAAVGLCRPKADRGVTADTKTAARLTQ